MAAPKMKTTVRSNPAINTPISAPGWFIKPNVSDNRYQQHGGTNIITPYICGSEYLPALKAALNAATKSIYISIWGFDPMLNLAHTGRLSYATEDVIGEILRKKAESGVEVKVLVFYTRLVDTGENNVAGVFAYSALSDGFSAVKDKPLSDYGVSLYQKQWMARAAEGKLPNLQLSTRPGTNEDVSSQSLEQLNERRKALGQGYGPSKILQSTLTDHQKMVLIDHTLPNQANGFVQGFNLLPDYFDDIEHPYHSSQRQGEQLIQDIGVGIKGTALVDLYHNFKESWNGNLRYKSTELITSPPDIDRLAALYRSSPYHVQILRTWPKTEEFNIERFYQNALSLNTDYLYVEDQYFRCPELVEWLFDRAKTLREQGSDKTLYLFVVTNTIQQAPNEGKSRQEVMRRFGREDMTDIETHREWAKHISNSAKMKAVADKVAALDVKLSIAVLKTANQSNSFTHYKDIYIHSKLTTFNDTCYTLGSANWNLRSMRADSELNIVVQHPIQTRAIRKKLWGLHFNHLLPDSNDMKKQHEQWQKLLYQNDGQLAYSKQPISRAFSYHESLKPWLNLG